MGPRLRIIRKSLLSGAQQAEGIAVVIDVLRAFTSAAFMVHLGAKAIVLLAEPEAVLKLKHTEGCLAVGEVDGKIVPGFDLGNSPSAISEAGAQRFGGRLVAQRTSAGVTGAVAAAKTAEQVLLGGYVTAGAIARHILEQAQPGQTITLVAMGSGGEERTPDDELCADYLEHLLTGRPYRHTAALQQIIAHECTQKFLRGDQAHYPAADPIYCLQRDLFDFVLVATLGHDRLVATRVDVPGSSWRAARSQC
jgi:2-phosphosulfolactate phosphatase